MTAPAPILVGVDGSPSSIEAADVAGREAVYRDADLVLVHVGPADDRVFERALVRLRLRHPTVRVHTRHAAADVDVAEVLARQAADGCLLLVGHRPNPPKRGAPPSVAQRLVDLTPVPAIVYRPVDLTCVTPEPRRVIAGVAPHGSPDGVLEFATLEAVRRRTTLDVLCATPATSVECPVGPDPAVVESVHRWFDKYPEVGGRWHVRDGIDPAIALMVESHAAQLVVIGTTGADAPVSVAHALVHRAACPVAVVPERTQ
jgi:nucleotide-binding universal stress UspA family protein